MIVDFPRVSTLTISVHGTEHYHQFNDTTIPEPDGWVPPETPPFYSPPGFPGYYSTDAVQDGSYEWTQVFTKVPLAKMAGGRRAGDPSISIWENPDIPEFAFILFADPLRPCSQIFRLLKIPQDPATPPEEQDIEINSPQIGSIITTVVNTGPSPGDSEDNPHEQEYPTRVLQKNITSWIESVMAWPDQKQSPFFRAALTRATEDFDIPHSYDMQALGAPEDYFLDAWAYPWRRYWSLTEPLYSPPVDFEAVRVQAADLATNKPAIQKITLAPRHFLKSAPNVEDPVPLSVTFLELGKLEADEQGFTPWDYAPVSLPSEASVGGDGFFPDGTGAPLNHHFYLFLGSMLGATGDEGTCVIGRDWNSKMFSAVNEYFTSLGPPASGFPTFEVFAENSQNILVVLYPTETVPEFPLLKCRCGELRTIPLEPYPACESGLGHMLIPMNSDLGTTGSRTLGVNRLDEEGNVITEVSRVPYVADGSGPSFTFHDEDEGTDNSGNHEDDPEDPLYHDPEADVPTSWETDFHWDYTVEVTFG